MSELTDREWWLVRRLRVQTLESVHDACERTGLPGRAVVAVMLETAGDLDTESLLRLAVASLLAEYKPGADPR